jgi:hypothetical protein
LGAKQPRISRTSRRREPGLAHGLRRQRESRGNPSSETEERHVWGKTVQKLKILVENWKNETIFIEVIPRPFLSWMIATQHIKERLWGKDGRIYNRWI